MKSLDHWFKEKLSLKPKTVVHKTIHLLKPLHPSPHPDHVPHQQERDILRITPLGGLDQVGRNMMVFETTHDIVIIDCGLQFPEEEMLGIDYVIPDVSSLLPKRKKIRGIIITHGHLDHIGALKHILPKLDFPPVFASRLTIGLIQKQLEEVQLPKAPKLHSIKDSDHLRLGSFHATFARITHNVPGALVVILHTPVGTIVHTGDFKFDATAPFPNDIPDFEKLSNVGKRGVLLLMSDSTNAMKEGYSKPEREVGETLDEIIQKSKGRVIIGSFASNIARIQQIINSAIKHGRKVFFSGRSMVNNLAIAKKLGYIKYPDKSVARISSTVNDLADEKVLVITTGSQGEEFAALARMANDKHEQIEIRKGDTIVLSSTPIPGTGNERSIYNIINKFIKKDATIITNEDLDVHASGHGQKEDLRTMIQLIHPQLFIPIHGELFMRVAHKKIALEENIRNDHIILLQNGNVLEVRKNGQYHLHNKPIELHNVYVDGLGGTENEGEKVLQERKNMSQDGMVIILYKVSSRDRKLIGAPKLISKGFIYMEELEKMITSVIKEAGQVYTHVAAKNKNAKQKDIRRFIRESLGTFIYKKIGREPLIIPLIVEV